jgi:hypothetical protein
MGNDNRLKVKTVAGSRGYKNPKILVLGGDGVGVWGLKVILW